MESEGKGSKSPDLSRRPLHNKSPSTRKRISKSKRKEKEKADSSSGSEDDERKEPDEPKKNVHTGYSEILNQSAPFESANSQTWNLFDLFHLLISANKKHVFSIIFVIVVYFSIKSYGRPMIVNVLITKNLLKEANELLHETKADFQNQSDLTWKVFNRTIKLLIETIPLSEEERKMPITILLLGTEDGREFVNCFSKRIQNLINSVIDDRTCSEIKATTLATDEDEMKMQLQSQILNTFEKPCHAAVVQDIDRLTSAGMMMLQVFSDDTSDYRDVILLLTATTKDPFPEEADIKTYSMLARKHLENAWTEHEDYRSAWLSRILGYVAVTKTLHQNTACNR